MSTTRSSTRSASPTWRDRPAGEWPFFAPGDEVRVARWHSERRPGFPVLVGTIGHVLVGRGDRVEIAYPCHGLHRDGLSREWMHASELDLIEEAR